MKQQLLIFLLRLGVNALVLWLAIRLLGTGYDNVDVTAGFWGFILAAFIFTAVNSVLKPLLVVISLPAILLTLGLFTLVVNGVLVYLSLGIAPGISMSFGNSIITGILLSLINYIVSAVFEIRAERTRS
ncbi:phage holin family protein [Candidatus Saccharibacteria bacterium]|nr:phage holin family protein [Candidatus Saccharibacteria bacterium]